MLGRSAHLLERLPPNFGAALDNSFVLNRFACHGSKWLRVERPLHIVTTEEKANVGRKADASREPGEDLDRFLRITLAIPDRGTLSPPVRIPLALRWEAAIGQTRSLWVSHSSSTKPVLRVLSATVRDMTGCDK